MENIFLNKDVVILILRISSNFSFDDCMNARLVAPYVRHDYIIKQNFKPWLGYAKLMNNINYFRKQFETIEFSSEFNNNFNDESITGVEIVENVEIFIAFVSNPELYSSIVKSYTNDDCFLINWSRQPSYFDEYGNLIHVFWSQIISSSYHVDFVKHGSSGIVKWKCDSYKENTDVTTEISKITGEELGCAIKMTNFTINSALLSRIKSISRFPGKQIIVLIE
jgi:hypothetical protein